MKTFACDEPVDLPFDRKEGAYLARFRHRSITRRILIRGAVSGAAVGIAGSRSFVPGLSVLAQGASSVTFGLEGDPAGLEPALAYDQTSSPVVNQISEPLMCFAPDGSLEPLLAEEFTQPDLLTYVYRLRPDLHFSDGTPVTAEDVVASIERIHDPRVASPLAWMYEGVTAVEQTDDRTVTVRLAAPSSMFKYVAATSAGHVIPKAAIQDPDRDLARDPIGTGPYTFVHWKAGSEIVLAKNEAYWQTDKPHFDRLTFLVLPEDTTRITGLRTGEIDLTTGLSADDIEVVKNLPNIEVQEASGNTITYVALRMDRPPFNELKVRQAVNHAINIEAIVQNIVKSSGIRSRTTTVPPHLRGSASDQLEPIPFDPAKAKRLLAEAGYPNGFSTTLTILAEDDDAEAEALAIQEDLKAINIDAEIIQLPFADYVDAATIKNYDGMLWVFWASDFPDAAGLLVPHFHSHYLLATNFAYYENPDVDALLDQSEQELDDEQRYRLLIDVQKLVAADQPYVFIDHSRSFLPMSSDLTGYTLTPMWMWDGFGRELRPR